MDRASDLLERIIARCGSSLPLPPPSPSPHNLFFCVPSHVQYLWKQFVLVGGLRNPTLSHLSDAVPPGKSESDRAYFTSLFNMFEKSAEVGWARPRLCLRFCTGLRPCRVPLDTCDSRSQRSVR